MFSVSMFNPQLLKGVRHLHFVGIGGSGMYPLVQILASKGYQISGSDVLEGSLIQAERAMGVDVKIGHDPANIDGADMVVYSAAIHKENCELVAAGQRGIPCIERSVLLGYVSRLYHDCIGVAGTHGKTTTTGMITTLLELAGRDPACVIGGKLPLIGGYGKAGARDAIVVEACEFSETFLHLTPSLGIILNIDNDHLDYFGTMGKLKLAFQKYALMCRTVCFNMDDQNCIDVVNTIDRPVRSFSTKYDEAYYFADNIREYKPGYYEFDVKELGQPFTHIQLGIPGFHNIYNALAMCCAVRTFRLSPEDAAKAAQAFTGTGRRFEQLGTTPGGAVVIDDYAHHPTELEATLKTARAMGYDRVIAVHQPFTYSRTKSLLQDFVRVLSQADEVVLEPILGSREVDNGTISSEDLADWLSNCHMVESHEEAAQYVRDHYGKGDLVVCMSCGDLYKAAHQMVE